MPVVNIKIKNIDKLKKLIADLESTVDEINHFDIEIESSTQSEHNPDISD